MPRYLQFIKRNQEVVVILITNRDPRKSYDNFLAQYETVAQVSKIDFMNYNSMNDTDKESLSLAKKMKA